MEREREKIRNLILRFGWNSTCYQLMNPGFRYWFSKDGLAAVGYVQYAKTRIVGGGPVCAFEHLPKVVAEFEAETSARGLHVCYFASEARLESLLVGHSGYAVLQLGAQPVWKPSELVHIIEAKQSLRSQLHRAENKGLVVREWGVREASKSSTLHAVLTQWLATRGLPSLHFLVEPETLAQLEDRRMFVATIGSDVVGFLNASPIPERHGWLIEQFVRGSAAPNGTVELMLCHAAKTFAEEGYDYLTLGLSPLTMAGKSSSQRTSPILQFLLGWARGHGKRFYNFAGLEFFKAKFEPETWEPIYAISNEKQFSLRALYAIACAFTNGRPVRTVLAGIGIAIRHEQRWLFRTR